MALWQWSTTPANNASGVTSINWAEGQPPSTVNDSARQMMADVAGWYQGGPEWLNYGFTPTYISGTQFTVSGNRTSTYTVGRRVRAFVTAGTIYGTVTGSSYASVTTVTVTWDAGNLDSGLNEVDVGILNPANSSVTLFPAITISNSNGAYSGALKLVGSGGYSPSIRSNGTSSQLEVLNSAGTTVNVSITDAGALTAVTVAASSDESLKSDWVDLPDSIIEEMAEVLSGTYTRLSTGVREAGVGAQSLQKVFPEVVLDGDHLSVMYGNAALALVVKLCKRVVALEKRLAKSGC